MLHRFTFNLVLALAVLAGGSAAVFVLAANDVQAAQGATFAYVADADVQVPGQGIRLVRVTGAFHATGDISRAYAIAKAEADSKARQYGTIVTGPVVTLVSPLVVGQIKTGIIK
jgi:hypothetical protein